MKNVERGKKVCRLLNKRGEEEETEEEKVEFGETTAWLSRGREERMTNGTAGSGTPHLSSCRSLSGANSGKDGRMNY